MKPVTAMKIAITTSSFAKQSAAPLDLLKAGDIAYVLNPHGRALTEDEAIEVLTGCTGVLAGTEPLTARVMAALPDLQVISRCGVGLDNVDMEAAKLRGIKVYNTPDGPTRAVAELTIGLGLSLLRLIPAQDRDIRSGVWKKRMGGLIQDKKLGVIGLGRIGLAVAGLFTALGAQVAYSDPLVAHDSYPRLELEELLTWAEILTVHAPPAKDRLLLDAERLNLLQPGAWLINAARGGLVDEAALLSLLEQGRLAGAALDVFGQEPYTGPLKELDNVILTPHVGSYAREARIKMETDAMLNLLAGLGLN